MAHTRAARYLRKRLRALLRRMSPCCVRGAHEPADSASPNHQAYGTRGVHLNDQLITADDMHSPSNTTAIAWQPEGQEQLLAAFVSNYVKEIIFNARVTFYIEDVIIKASLALIGSMVPTDKMS